MERGSQRVDGVARTRRFFGSGKLTRKKWNEALVEVTAEFQQFAATYRALGWQEALGSSGTNKAIGEICAKMGLTKGARSEEHTSELQSLMRISYAVFCLKKKKQI